LSARKDTEVLVVDDDDSLRQAVADLLRDEGFSVVEKPNGLAALDHLFAARTMPSLILLDLNMPVMSGQEMLRVLSGYLRFAAIPVLVVTAEVLRPDSPEEGSVGRLQKPYSAEHLLALVRRHAKPAREDETSTQTSYSRLRPAPG
jgi:CheY-like chemotaxis protein